MSLSDIQEILTVPIIGAVTDEEEIVISSNNGEPVAGKDSPLGQIFVDICRRIMGEDIPVAQPSVSKGLIKRLKSIWKRKENKVIWSGIHYKVRQFALERQRRSG